MDIRGIEVTNQLRSAIRAKLLELGVRYDEELPDYILVMVVNKKSRQQMHEDLYLFLEDSTTPFVDWLHDQVLKKLQKVTIAKKKSSREFVPTVVVKQEEERKKKKSCTTSFLEDQTTELSTEKVIDKPLKEDKSLQKQSTTISSSEDADTSQNKAVEKINKDPSIENRLEDTSSWNVQQESPTKKVPCTTQLNTQKEDTPAEKQANKFSENRRVVNDTSKNLKRTLDATEHDASEKKCNDTKKAKVSDKVEDSIEDNSKKLKSCVNKPKITSVVSIKNRLGVISPRKKFEVYRERTENESRYRQSDKRFERHRYDTNRDNFQRGRSFEIEDRSKKSKTNEFRSQEQDKNNDIKSRLGITKGERLNKNSDIRDKINSGLKTKINERLPVTIKDRLGIINNNKSQKQSAIKSQEAMEYKNSKCLEQDREVMANKNIKNRLGPLRNNFKPVHGKINLNTSGKHSQSSEDDDCINLGMEEGLDEDAQSVINSGPIKSHIIAVKKPTPHKPEKRFLKPIERVNQIDLNDLDDEEVEELKLPSKVIVTPRPLKPLQPTQKRATQSLLLRAVAEANQSVVTQKNPEPSLVDKKPALKRLRPPISREVGQNLSVHFNANKRLVMEKIQVELNTMDTVQTEPKSYISEAVTDERMGVVMSLFQRSDDNQKFLVTLNGYNNNHSKDKATSDDEERLEMEVNEDDELALLNTQNDVYTQNESETNVFRITDTEDDTDATGKDRSEENNENCNTENVDAPEEVPRKKRKLSPIVYNRSPTQSPIDLKSNLLSSTPLPSKQKKDHVEALVPVIDKTKEKCRYWPNCTLGNKCAFLHPTVMCSAFPACKFGDKCAYKHPKCKFGLSCTKLGCVFTHPSQQCKYHPFCTKPACPYSHPVTPTPVSIEATSQRAKFTWRRRD